METAGNRCRLDVTCTNHEEQQVPLEPAFYANVLADLYLLTVLELPTAPVSLLEANRLRPRSSRAPGVPWFWHYALHYCEDERDEISRKRAVFGPPVGLAGPLDEGWMTALAEEVEPLCHQLQTKRIEGRRTEDDTDSALIELRVPDPALIEFLRVGLTLSTAYGPYTTWDCL